MREKYIEDRFPRWFEFGFHTCTDLVDVADTHGDVADRVSKATAHRLIRERHKIVDALIWAVNRLAPEDQSRFLAGEYENGSNEPRSHT